MSYHLVYRESVALRDLNYSSQPKVGEGEEWQRTGGGPRGIQEVGYRTWIDDETKKSILVINCKEDWLVLNAFTRLMDCYQYDVCCNRPWRVFALFLLQGRQPAVAEIVFARDHDEYRLVRYSYTSWPKLKELLGDESAHASYESVED